MMGRWRNLDFEPAAGLGGEVSEGNTESYEATRERRRYGPLVGMAPPRHPAVAAARGLYLLKNWQGVVHSVGAAVLSRADAREGWVLLGMASARLGEESAATAAFEAAVRVNPGDGFTRCAYASFLLRQGRDQAAREVL